MRWRCWCSALEPGYCNWLVHRRASGRGVTGLWDVLPKPRGAGGATLAAQSKQGKEHSRPSLVDRRRTTRGAPLPPGAPRVSVSARRNVRRPFHGPGEHEPSRRGVVVQQLGVPPPLDDRLEQRVRGNEGEVDGEVRQNLFVFH